MRFSTALQAKVVRVSLKPGVASVSMSIIMRNLRRNSDENMSSSSAIQNLSRQAMLLRMEYEEEKDTFLKQTREMGVLRKVKGATVFPEPRHRMLPDRRRQQTA